MKLLNNGIKIEDIGFGTWYLKGNEGKEVIKNAIKVGYRIIDTAQAYNNEEIVGQAINECIQESIVKRQDLFITSKINPHLPIGYDAAINAVNQSLAKMNLDYIDLYLIHWPNLVEDDSWKYLNAKTWQGFEKMVTEGKLKSIGVSNFMIHHLEELLKTATIKPSINQLNLNPTWQQKEVVKFCHDNNILCEAWAPLVRIKPWNLKTLETIAKKYKKTIAQICLRWCLQKGFIPLTKSHQVEHMIENINIFNFEIEKEDIDYLDELNSHPWDHDSQPDCLYEIFRLREQLTKKEIILKEKFYFLGIHFANKKILNNKNVYLLFNILPLFSIKKVNETKKYIYLFNLLKIGKIIKKTKTKYEKFLPTYINQKAKST